MTDTPRDNLESTEPPNSRRGSWFLKTSLTSKNGRNFTPPPRSISETSEGPMSAASANRNSVPIVRNGELICDKQRMGLLATKKDSDMYRKQVLQTGSSKLSVHVPLKNIKLVNSSGIPLLIVTIIEYCRSNQLLSKPNLFRAVGNDSEVWILREQFERSDQIDLSCADPASLFFTLKSFILGISEPFLTFDLFESFTACLEISDEERKLAQLQYLLEMIPLQNYNVVSYITHFLSDCVSRSMENGLTCDQAGRIFGQAYLRTHAISSIDELERQQSAMVTKLLIEKSELLFKESVNINDKKAEASREKRRKKAKEMLSNFRKNEKKKEKEKEKQKKKSMELKKSKKPSWDSDSLPLLSMDSSSPTEPIPITKDNNNTVLAHRRTSSVSSPMVKKSKSLTPSARDIRTNTSVQLNTLLEPSTTVDARLNQFYQYGFYAVLFLFVLSHIIRTFM